MRCNLFIGSSENPTCSTPSVVITQRPKGGELRAGQTLEALTPKAGFTIDPAFLLNTRDTPPQPAILSICVRILDQGRNERISLFQLESFTLEPRREYLRLIAVTL
jgi:hypothetical protein